jgi:hypothetical protein
VRRRGRSFIPLVCVVGAALTGEARAQPVEGETPPEAAVPAAPPPPADYPAPLPSPPTLDAAALTPSPPVVEVVEAAPAPRPRLTFAIGYGVAFESAGLARTEPVPAFFAVGGVGADWPVGVELAAFASSATGRFAAPAAPVDRLALSLIGVVRPLSWSFAPGDTRYGARFLRALGIEVGPGLERAATSMRAGSRFGVHTGLRVEAPIVPAGSPGELRLRLAVRYMYGLYTPQVGTTAVGDGVELYGALVTVF